MKQLSVIIPVFNGQKTIARVLKAVFENSYDNFEVVVVDDCSQDDTLAVVARFAKNVRFAIKVLKQTRQSGPSAARNRGAQNARGEILLFLDSDVLIPPDYFEKLVQSFEKHPEVAAVNGVFAPDSPNPDFLSQLMNLDDYYVFSRLPEINCKPNTSAFAIRKKEFFQCGGFDESFSLACNDDKAFGLRMAKAGYVVRYDRDLVFRHLKRYSLSEFINNHYNNGYYWVKVYRKYKDSSLKKTDFVNSLRAPLNVLMVLLFLIIMFCKRGPRLKNAGYWMLAFLGLNMLYLHHSWKFKGTLFMLGSVFLLFAKHFLFLTGVIGALWDLGRARPVTPD